MSNKLRIFISILLLLVVVTFSFYPSLKNYFVNWDDNMYLLTNSLVKNLSSDNVKKIFTSSYYLNYQPLVLLSYAFEYKFFKLNPFWYHFNNLFLHLLNSVLVFWLIFLISKNIGISLITSILFGVHPLHVESVAWVSGRKDVLYAFFYLSALIVYIYYLRSIKKTKYYIFTLVFFTLSCISKSTAITLSPLLFIFDYICNRKYTKFVLLEKIPFFVISFIFGVISILSQDDAIRKDIVLSIFSKVKVASYCIFFYIEKIFVPVKLSCFYPFPKISNNFMPSIFNYSFFLTISIVIIIFLTARYTKRVIFGFLFFLISIFLNLQFIPLGGILTADRYTYIPALGIFFILAVIFIWLIKKIAYNFLFKVILVSTLMLLIANFAYLTWDRCKIWKDSFILWNDVIDKYGDENIPIAYYNRGLVYLGFGGRELAVLDFKKIVEYGYKWLDKKNEQSIIYQKVEDLGDNYANLLNLAAKEILEIGLIREGMDLFRQLIFKKIFFNSSGYLYVSSLLANREKYDEAIFLGKYSIKLNPHFEQGYYNMAIFYFLKKNYKLSNFHLQTALKLGCKDEQHLLNELSFYL